MAESPERQGPRCWSDIVGNSSEETTAEANGAELDNSCGDVETAADTMIDTCTDDGLADGTAAGVADSPDGTATGVADSPADAQGVVDAEAAAVNKADSDANAQDAAGDGDASAQDAVGDAECAPEAEAAAEPTTKKPKRKPVKKTKELSERECPMVAPEAEATAGVLSDATPRKRHKRKAAAASTAKAKAKQRSTSKKSLPKKRQSLRRRGEQHVGRLQRLQSGSGRSRRPWKRRHPTRQRLQRPFGARVTHQWRRRTVTSIWSAIGVVAKRSARSLGYARNRK